MCGERCRRVHHIISPWLILLFCVLGSTIMMGTVRCFTIIIDEMSKEYGNQTTLFELDWIVDTERGGKFVLIPVFTSVMATIMPRINNIYLIVTLLQAGFMITAYVVTSVVYNADMYFLTYSFPVAMGLSLFMANATLVVAEQFDNSNRFHVFATSIFAAGPLGSLVMCGINGVLVRRVGWRWTLRYIAGSLGCVAVFGIVVVACRTKPPQGGSDNAATDPTKGSIDEMSAKEKIKTNDVRKITWLNILRMPVTYAWFAHCAVHQAAICNIMFNLSSYLSHKYALKLTNFVAILCFGLGTASSFLAWAIFGKYLRGYFSYAVLVSVCAATVWLTVWNFVGLSLPTDTAFAFVGGFILNSGIASAYPVGEEIIGIQGYYGYSVYNLATGIGIVSAPLSSGLLADIFDFKYYFLFQAVLTTIDIACVLIIIFLACLQKSTVEETDDVDLLTKCGSKSSLKQPSDREHLTRYGTSDLSAYDGCSK